MKHNKENKLTMRGYIKNLTLILVFSVALPAVPFFVLGQDSTDQAQLIKKIRELQQAIDQESQSIQSLRGKVRGSSSFQKELDARLAEKDKTIEDLRDQLRKARVASDKSDKTQELSRQLDAKERELTEAGAGLKAAARQIQETEDSLKQSQEKQKDKQGEIDKLRQELIAKENELAQAGQAQETINKRIKEMASQITSLENEKQAIPDLSGQLQAKDKKISQLEAELIASGQREAALTDQARQAQSSGQAKISLRQGELENRLAAKDKDLAGLGGELDLAKSELERVRQEKDKKIEELQAELIASGQREAALTDQARQAQSSGQAAAPDDTVLRQQLEAKDEELAAVRDKLKQTQDKQAQLFKEVEDVTAQVTALKSQAPSGKVSEQLKQKDKDLADLRKQLKDKDMKISELQKELVASGQREAALNEQARQAQSNKQAAADSDWRRQLETKDNEIAGLLKERDAAVQELENTRQSQTQAGQQVKADQEKTEAIKADLAEKDKKISRLEAELVFAGQRETQLAKELETARTASGSGKREALMDEAMQQAGFGQEEALRKELAASQKELQAAKDKLKASQVRQDMLAKEIEAVTNQVNQIKASRYPKESTALLAGKDKRINELEIKVAAQDALLRQSRAAAVGSREQGKAASAKEQPADVKELQKQLAAKEETLRVMEARLRAYEQEKVTLVKDMNETNNRIQDLATKIVREQPQDSFGNKAELEKLRVAVQEAIGRLDELKASEGSYNY